MSRENPFQNDAPSRDEVAPEAALDNMMAPADAEQVTDLPEAGERVIITRIKEGSRTILRTDRQSRELVLQSGIKIGRTVLFEGGQNTGEIETIRAEGDTWVIKTQHSEYEITRAK